MAEPSPRGGDKPLVTVAAVDSSIEDGQRLFGGDVEAEFENLEATNAVEAVAAAVLINAAGRTAVQWLEEERIEDDPLEIARLSAKTAFLIMARALRKMRAGEDLENGRTTAGQLS